MQPNNPTTPPATPPSVPPSSAPTTDNVAPAGPVLVENVPIVQQGAAPSAAPQPINTVPAAAPQAQPAAPQQHAKPAAAPKPKQHKSSAPKPWATIFIALIVAVVLAAFAFKSYKS